MKAIWQDTILAESSRTVTVEGVEYFPPEDVRQDLLEPSDTRTVCPWKGEATYFTVTVGEQSNRDAAWTYSEPRDVAANFKGYIAFWRGVQVIAN